MNIRPLAIATACVLACAATAQSPPKPNSPSYLTYKGTDGPGKGKHIVLIAAEQEYRAEQAMPMLARMLTKHHGFDCTVLFAQNNGMVDPTQKTRPEVKDMFHDIPGIELLATADLAVLFNRFITLPDAQIAYVIDYLESGKPLIGIRTANHGFSGNFPYKIDDKRVRFGVDVLGGTFRGHHGGWHRESTRGIIIEENRDHPILRGVTDVWGPSDVYRMYPKDKSLPESCQALLLGQPLVGLDPKDEPNIKKEALPIAWTNTWAGSKGNSSRIFHVTMGSARDFQSAGLRRLTTNACYWCLKLEDQIKPNSNVDIVGNYQPLKSGFNYEALGVKPRPASYYR